MLDTISDDKDFPKFVTKIWIEVYDQSEKNCNVNKEIRIKNNTPFINWGLADMTVRRAGNNDDPVAIVAPTGLEFQITNTKLYDPVVTFSK